MNRTKIEWCDYTWNPVTGCFHDCPYCYARRIAERFGSRELLSWGYRDYLVELEVLTELSAKAPPDMSSDSEYTWKAWHPMFELKHEMSKTAFPFKFYPTLHCQKLDEPQHSGKARNIFVCSMADLFGDWVPLRWIRDVLDACLAAPKHRYLFLTKNPRQYDRLEAMALLPTGDRFWYGATVTKTEDFANIPTMSMRYRQFLSIEPLLDRVDMYQITGHQRWVIIGAETGKRENKVIPRREWVDEITEYCTACEIPVFYKDSLRKLFPDLPPSQFPW